MSEKEVVINIFGDEIEACCYDPMTGYFRDGYCNTDEMIMVLTQFAHK